MLDRRWKKVISHLMQHRSRSLLVVLAITVGLVASGAVLNTYFILQQGLREGYLATNPPSAVIQTENIDDVLLTRIADLSDIAEAESMQHVDGLAMVGDRWQPIRLFVPGNYARNSIGRLEPLSGVWPPPDGEIVLERSSVEFAGAELGDSLRLGVVHGVSRNLPISGVVRDSGLAPGWMEHIVYGFVTPTTLESLGGSVDANRLQIVVAEDRLDGDHVRKVAFAAKALIESTGRTVYDVSVPEAGRHEHAEQMDSLLFIQGALGTLAFFLSAMLILNLMTAVLADEIREIGVMKAIGARTDQIAGIYLTLAVTLGLAACIPAIPLASWMGTGYANYVADLLNFDISGQRPPAKVTLLVIAAGALLPLLASIIPVWKASGSTVAETLRDYGIGGNRTGSGPENGFLGWVSGPLRPALLSLRNTFRRRLRLSLTLLALSLGGAVFLGTLNLKTSIRRQVDTTFAAMHYDIDLRFEETHPVPEIRGIIELVPGVAGLEIWGSHRANLVHDDGTESSGFPLAGLVPDSRMIDYPLVEGRWPESGDTHALVANNQFMAAEPDLLLGERVTLRVGSRITEWTIIGVAISSPGRPVTYADRDVLANLLGEAGRGSRALVTVNDGETGSTEAVRRRIRRALEEAGLEVGSAHITGQSRVVLEDHLLMVSDFLMVMALIVVLVGGLGLATSMNLSVQERTREIGVMQAIGASHRAVLGIIIGEGLFIGVLSCLIALPLSIPMSILVGNAFGQIMFQTPIVFVTEPTGILIWTVIVVVIAGFVSLFPALRVLQRSTREALAFE